MRMMMAGADMERHINIMYIADHPYMLSSYYTAFKKKGPKWFAPIYSKMMQKGAFWIMDSGLFSMMFGAESHRIYCERDLERYMHQYIGMMEDIGYRSVIVEMDVHKVLGISALRRFREVFEKKWSIDRTIYVWHIEETEAGWIEMARRYPYIAISIPELRKICKEKSDIKAATAAMIAKARDINPEIKIHLLGCTENSIMEQAGYYSCDSTSWLASQMYSQGSIWRLGAKRASCYSPEFREQMEHISAKLLGRLQTVENIESLSKSKLNYYLSSAASIAALSLGNKTINRMYYDNEPIRSLWNE